MGVFGCLHLRVLASRNAGWCCLVAMSQAIHMQALCLVGSFVFGWLHADLDPGSHDPQNTLGQAHQIRADWPHLQSQTSAVLTETQVALS